MPCSRAFANRGVTSMSTIGKQTILCAALLALTCINSGRAADDAVPNFAPNDETGWVPARSEGDDFISPKSGPGPVVAEKDNPYVPNNPRTQPTYRIADLTNPILKP